MILSKKKILALAPHPDDIEFGCGASVHKWISQGAEVWYAAFSSCDKSLPENFPKGEIYRELDVSSKELGVKGDHLFKFNFEVRDFPRDRQAILERIVQLRKEHQPDLVLVPSRDDIHQDHKVICEEAIRAFKHSSILGYELGWNLFETHLNYFEEVEQQNLDAKKSAIKAFKTQESRAYAHPDFMENLAKLRGGQTGVALAEAFEIIRLLS